MSDPPNPLKVYHITHAKNLKGILAEGRLWSDAQRLKRNLNCDVVGLSHVSQEGSAGKLRRFTTREAPQTT